MIKTWNLGDDQVKEVRLQTLNTKFKYIKTGDTSTIDDFAAKLSRIASKSSSLGEVINEQKLAKKFLLGLRRRFVHIVAALEQVFDLKMIGFKTQVKLLYSKTKSSNRNNDRINKR